ncbi:MAG: hypothetical protein Q8P05_02970 [Candidatus Diapherotrites archaeon]|nr:hypothetical protein [Candidatus Diapherotrites archaeon]
MLRGDFFEARLCDSQLSYEFVPKQSLKLPLFTLGRELKDAGLYVEINTPFIVQVKLQDTKISLYPSGKVFVKHVSEKKQAQTLFRRMVKALNACPAMAKI